MPLASASAQGRRLTGGVFDIASIPASVRHLGASAGGSVSVHPFILIGSRESDKTPRGEGTSEEVGEGTSEG